MDLNSAHHLLKVNNFTGWYKRAYIVVLGQAKFYPPWQAAAAAAGSTSSIVAAAVHELECSLSCTAALVLWQLQIFIPHVLRLIYCGSYVFGCFGRSTRAAVHKG